MGVLAVLQRATRRALVARGVDSRMVEVGGQRVHHYRVQGRGGGPPLVLVHGLGGSANGFARVLRPLAARFRAVWAPDLPGHGFSPPYRGGPTSIRNQYEVLRAFVREGVGEPALVLGNSLGGAMSITLAAEEPALVRALVLVAPAGAALAPERLHSLLESFEVTSAAQARALTRRLFHRAPVTLMLLGSELRHFYATPAVRALIMEAAEARAALDPEKLACLAMPTLLLWGGSERLLPEESVDFFRAHLPAHARLEVVAGFGHVPQLERPGELVRRLVAFADEVGL